MTLLVATSCIQVVGRAASVGNPCETCASPQRFANPPSPVAAKFRVISAPSLCTNPEGSAAAICSRRLLNRIDPDVWLLSAHSLLLQPQNLQKALGHAGPSRLYRGGYFAPLSPGSSSPIWSFRCASPFASSVCSAMCSKTES